MRIFVASWFFPPATSSEGIAAFKLLSHSTNHYDVCSSLSDQWGYEAKTPLSSDNITHININTDDIEEWLEFALAEFTKRHKNNPYDCVMTRSMPPESILFGERVKDLYPDLPWVASLGDPISRVPQMMRDYLDKTKSLTESQKKNLRNALSSLDNCSNWIGIGDKGVDVLCKYKAFEVAAIKKADMLIFPNGPQAHFSLCGLRRPNVCIIPHTFDPALYPKRTTQNSAEKKTFVFLGAAYKDRSLEPFIHALHLLDINNPEALSKLKIRLVGSIADDTKDLVFNYFLQNVVSIEPGVGYLDSLRIMQDADWLLHVDGFFKEFNETGGSIYLAGKLADYMGTNHPILAISGSHSPASRLVEQYGGLVFDSWNQAGIADAFERIALGTVEIETNSSFAMNYAAHNQAHALDQHLEALQIEKNKKLDDASPHSMGTLHSSDAQNKLLSICVPAYNVEGTLQRTLDSFIACDATQYLDVIVVNDGSSDGTLDVAKRYERLYSNFIRVVDKKNGGHGSTINAALAIARGEYFRVVDGDDWLDPTELSKHLAVIEKLDKPIDIISADYCQIFTETGRMTHIKKKSDRFEYNKAYSLKDHFIDKEYFSLGSMSYRTQLLRDCNLKLTEHCFYVDVQYQMFPLPLVESIMFTNGNLYHYAIGNSEQSISQTSFVARYDDHDTVIRSVLVYYMNNHNNMLPSIRSYYETLVLNHFLKTHYTISLLFDVDKKRGCARAKEFDEFLKSINPEWHRKAGELYPILKILRENFFNCNLVENLKSLNSKGTIKKLPLHKSAARNAAKKIMSGGIGDIVASEVKKRK